MARHRPPSPGRFGRLIGLAIVAALIFRAFGYEAFAIPSGSMMPTLLVGDTVLVSKICYGVSRFSFPFWHPGFSGRWFGRLPKRGDVIVFKLPRDTSKDYIKRVVGLPGDRIQMIGGVLHINGVKMPQERIADFMSEADGSSSRLAEASEILPGGDLHAILEIGDRGIFDDTPAWTVPPNNVFVLGDNRRASEDSRAMDVVGFVPIENIVGRADIRLFSLVAGVRWWELWRWPQTLRRERVFSVID